METCFRLLILVYMHSLKTRKKKHWFRARKLLWKRIFDLKIFVRMRKCIFIKRPVTDWSMRLILVLICVLSAVCSVFTCYLQLHRKKYASAANISWLIVFYVCRFAHKIFQFIFFFLLSLSLFFVRIEFFSFLFDIQKFHNVNCVSPSPWRGTNKLCKWFIIFLAYKFGSSHIGFGTLIFGCGYNADSHSQ